MVTKPLISFITVTYQAEFTLCPTLNRLLEQTDTSFECLVIDGASTDGTLALIKEYSEKFSHRGVPFKWVSEPDKGLYHAMNKGMAMANGIYVWFMNAGDRLGGVDIVHTIKKKIALKETDLVMDNVSANLPDFIYGETTIVDSQYNNIGPRRLKAPECLTWKHFRWGMLVCHQAMLVKRGMAPSFNVQYRYSADFDWAINSLKQANRICNSKMVLCEFLNGGLTTIKMNASLKERFAIMQHHYGLFSTLLLHVWFIIRASWFKLRHGWI